MSSIFTKPIAAKRKATRGKSYFVNCPTNTEGSFYPWVPTTNIITHDKWGEQRESPPMSICLPPNYQCFETSGDILGSFIFFVYQIADHQEMTPRILSMTENTLPKSSDLKQQTFIVSHTVPVGTWEWTRCVILG